MYHILINPASRSGRGHKIWTETRQILEQEGLPYKAHLSKQPGDISTFARDLTANADAQNPIHLIILGGDGTLNETIQNLRNPEHVILSYIPTGSSNDLARDLKLPVTPRQALHNIVSNTPPHPTDMGILRDDKGTSRRFNVSCGIGFDAGVCECANRSKAKAALNKIGLGKLVYLLIALKQLVSAKRISCNLYIDKDEPIHLQYFLFIAAMNHRFEGGGFRFCPDADHQDGLMDICVVGSLPKLFILLALPTAFWGKHTWFPGIDIYRGRTIRIQTDAPLWVHTDGEIIGQAQDITIDCQQQKLNFKY